MTAKPGTFEPSQPGPTSNSPALFQAERDNPYLVRAADLTQIFACDAVERDRLRGQPDQPRRPLHPDGRPQPVPGLPGAGDGLLTA